jgi:hypothetical protein
MSRAGQRRERDVMAVKIRSLLVSGPLLVPLSSGVYVRLSPGGTTEELADVEVTNNAKVDELRDQRLIEVEPVAADAPGAAPEQSPGPRSTGDGR